MITFFCITITIHHYKQKFWTFFADFLPEKLLQIVLGDKSDQKAFKYTGITCFNPGSFANDSTFAAYRPCTKEVELSALES